MRQLHALSQPRRAGRPRPAAPRAAGRPEPVDNNPYTYVRTEHTKRKEILSDQTALSSVSRNHTCNRETA